MMRINTLFLNNTVHSTFCIDELIKVVDINNSNLIESFLQLGIFRILAGLLEKEITVSEDVSNGCGNVCGSMLYNIKTLPTS